MDWAKIKPILVDAELYSSLIVNTYVIMVGLVFASGWLTDRLRGSTHSMNERFARSLEVSTIPAILLILFAIGLQIMTFAQAFPEWTAQIAKMLGLS